MDDLFRFLMLRTAKPAPKASLTTSLFSDDAKRLAGREPAVTQSHMAALFRASPRFALRVGAGR